MRYCWLASPSLDWPLVGESLCQLIVRSPSSKGLEQLAALLQCELGRYEKGKLSVRCWLSRAALNWPRSA